MSITTVNILIVINLLLLLLVLRQSYFISKLPVQIRTLRLMISKQKENLVQIIGADFVAESVDVPKVSRVEEGKVYFEDNIEVTEPETLGDYYSLVFGSNRLYYQTLQDALASAYSISTQNRCLLAGIIDIEPLK
jgi:hypothetical protein